MKRLLQFLLVFVSCISVVTAQDDVLQFDDANSQRLRYSTTTNDILDTKLNGATDYTIEVWVRPTSTDIHNNVILKRWNQFALTMYQDANKRFYFTHYGASSTYVNSTFNAININEWNHLVVICNSGANTLKLFANGVEVTGDSSGNPTSQTALSLAASPASSNLYIGYGGSGSYLIGQVDKVRVKNTAESIASLQTVVTDVAYTVDANTAILYNFNEGSGNTTKNEADNVDADLLCVSAVCAGSVTWWANLPSTLSLNKNNITKFKLYPNPVSNNTFIVQTKDNESIQDIEVFDILGKSVRKMTFGKNTFFTQISTENLTSGMYLVKIKTDAGIGTQKVLIN